MRDGTWCVLTSAFYLLVCINVRYTNTFSSMCINKDNCCNDLLLSSRRLCDTCTQHEHRKECCPAPPCIHSRCLDNMRERRVGPSRTYATPANTSKIINADGHDDEEDWRGPAAAAARSPDPDVTPAGAKPEAGAGTSSPGVRPAALVARASSRMWNSGFRV